MNSPQKVSWKLNFSLPPLLVPLGKKKINALPLSSNGSQITAAPFTGKEALGWERLHAASELLVQSLVHLPGLLGGVEDASHLNCWVCAIRADSQKG